MLKRCGCGLAACLVSVPTPTSPHSATRTGPLQTAIDSVAQTEKETKRYMASGTLANLTKKLGPNAVEAWLTDHNTKLTGDCLIFVLHSRPLKPAHVVVVNDQWLHVASMEGRSCEPINDRSRPHSNDHRPHDIDGDQRLHINLYLRHRELRIGS